MHAMDGRKKRAGVLSVVLAVLIFLTPRDGGLYAHKAITWSNRVFTNPLEKSSVDYEARIRVQRIERMKKCRVIGCTRRSAPVHIIAVISIRLWL